MKIINLEAYSNSEYAFFYIINIKTINTDLDEFIYKTYSRSI